MQGWRSNMDGNSGKYIDVVKVIRKRYIFALSVIILALILTQVIIQYNINNQMNYSRVVNISGRQRMLSQQISKDVYALYSIDNKEEISNYIEDLNTTVSTWKKSNTDLQNGNVSEGISIKNSEKIKEMFKVIQVPYDNIIDVSDDIIKMLESGSYSKADLLNKVNLIESNERVFLKGMDDIVFQYDSEAKAKIVYIKNIELVLFIITMLLILFEILFIFVPAEKSIIKAFQEIIESRKNFYKLFEVAPGAMFLVDHDTDNVILLNKQGEHFKTKVCGHDEEVNFNNFSGSKSQEYKELFEKIKVNEKIENEEVVIRTKKENSMAMLISSIKLYFDKKSTILIAFADITNQKREKEVLKKLASYDELTGLYNRRFGQTLLENTYLRAQSGCLDFSVCFIDIDGLKFVNDNLGHEEGDWYIKTIADTIKENVRENDCVFRYGGDEIVAVFENYSVEEVNKMAKKIEEKLNMIQASENKSYNLSISAGAVNFKDNSEYTLEEILRQADYIMYEKKKLKKSCR